MEIEKEPEKEPMTTTVLLQKVDVLHWKVNWRKMNALQGTPQTQITPTRTPTQSS